MTIDVSNAVNSFQGNLEDFSAQISNARNQQTDMTNQAADITNQVGSNEATIELTKQNAIAGAQQRTSNYQSTLAPEEKIAQLSQDFWDNYNAAQQVSDVILQKRSSSFLDNPIQAMSDRFTVGRDIAVQNTLADKANTALETSQQISNAVSANAASNIAAAKTVDQQSAALMADNMADKAKLAANALRVNGIGYQVDLLNTLQNVSQQQLNSVIQLHQVQNSDANLAISQQHLDLARDEAARHADEFAERMSLKNADAADKLDYANKINLGRKIQNLPAMSPIEIERVIKNDPNGKASFTSFYQSGAALQETGMAQITSDPAKSALILAANRGSLPDGAGKTQSFLTEMVNAGTQKLSADPSLSAADKKPTLDNIYKQMSAPTTAAVGAMLNDRSLPITKSGNIYAAPDINAAVKFTPALKDLPFYQVALQPLAAIGQGSASVDQIIASGTLAVQQGKLSHNDLVDGIVKYFGAANIALDATQGYKTVGLPIPTNYLTTANTASMNPFSKTTKLDLTNSAQVSRFVTGRILNESKLSLGGEFARQYAPDESSLLPNK